MNSLDANIRNNKTKGELNALKNNGDVPAIIYGGEAQNEKISISKKVLKSLVKDEFFPAFRYSFCIIALLVSNILGLKVKSLSIDIA